MRIGVIGASGFIGLRAIEIFHLGNVADVRPVVRSAGSLGVLARMQMDWRICDLLDKEALAGSLRGCDVCVQAAIGDASQIVRMASAAYKACARGGVSRLVWISSASVHGQNPPPGTDETSSLNDRQPMAYNNAKVRAEWALDQLGGDGQVEVVKLRPSVVFGPRSRWIADAAEALLVRRAGWIDSGRGICNSVYVDNLVEAIRLAAITPGVAGSSFLLGDAETVRWREFLLPIADRLGFTEEAFDDVAPLEIAHERDRLLTAFTMSPFYGRVGGKIPFRLKRVIKAVAHAWPEQEASFSPWTPRLCPAPRLTGEMSQLQQCAWKLPIARAERMLGYRPQVPFAEGMSRSLAWLEFAGFPVKF